MRNRGKAWRYGSPEAQKARRAAQRCRAWGWVLILVPLLVWFLDSYDGQATMDDVVEALVMLGGGMLLACSAVQRALADIVDRLPRLDGEELAA